MAEIKTKLIILDLDETLIFSIEGQANDDTDFRFGNFQTYKRPYLEEFLEFCFNNFQVAVWTASTKSYAEEIIENIFEQDQKPVFVYTRNNCTQSYDSELQESILTKKMWKIRRKGFDLKKVIVIDDSPEQWSNSYGNLIRVKKFFGSKNDNELKLLIKYLKKIINAENFRKIGKRGWRNSIKSS